MSTSAAAKAVTRAVRYLRRKGPEAGRPINHLEAMMADRASALEALERALDSGADHDLEAAVRLAGMLEARELSDAIAAGVLRRPAPLEAKRAALDTLAELGVEVPAEVAETLRSVRAFVDEPDEAGLEKVLSLPESWRRPTIAAWLERGARRVELLERLLESEPGLKGEIIDGLGESGDPAAVPVLRRLAEEADKERRKRVRRALHRLRAAGIDTEEDSEPAEAFSFALETDPSRARAWSSGIDGGGGRILWFLAPDARGGEELLEAVVDDAHGIRKADVLSVTRKGFRAHLDKLRDNPGILIVELPPDNAVGVLRAAAARGEQAGEELPSEYVAWTEGIGAAILERFGAGPETPPVAPPIPGEGEVDADRLAESVELLKDPIFANWAVLGEVAEEAALGVRRAETSDLVVDDEQRKEQIDQAIAGAAIALDEEARNTWRKRLESMAELLERARREEQARLAAEAARGFTAISDLYASHPFARAMVQRGVLAAYQGVRERETERDSESRIVTP